jgi:hypothetical protein
MAARRVERTVTTRETRATSRIADGPEEVETAPKAGMGLGDAMGIVTFLLLVTAIVLLDMYLGRQYGPAGVFFAP